MFPFLVDTNMILTKKIQEGDKTPILYNFYEGQYNFDDLSKAVDSGINEHISTLKKGKKYEREFREAVANIMSGVKDGTITFENGRYNDSLGRYSNAEDKDKDVYGWAANYVYNNMKRIPKYTNLNTTLDSSKKYNNIVLGRALTKTIFGTDNGNILYFWDADALDPGSRNGRINVLNEAISLMDVDDILKDYSDADKATARLNLLLASQILQGGISPGELLKLSKIFGGIDWNNWMKTDFNKTSQELQEKKGVSKDLFFEYINSTHPLYLGNLASVTLSNTVQSDELEQFAQRLNKYDNHSLQSIDIDKLDNDSKGVAIDFLIARNLLPKSDGIYIIPRSLKNETVLTYNPKTQLLSRKRTHELSYYRKLWINDYTLQYGSSTDLLSQYFTEFKKNGGILKALTGVKFSNKANYYSGVFLPLLDHILQGLKKDSNYYAWLNDMLDRHNEIYRAAGNDWQNTAYKNDIVGNYLNLYKSGYNNEWKDNMAGYNSLGIQNALNQEMFDISGRKRTSGDWGGNGNNWNTDNLYSAITDYRRLLGRKGDYTPEQLAYITTLFKNVGYNFIKDANGYYKLDPIEPNNLEEEVPVDNKKDDKVGSRVYPIGTLPKTDGFDGNRFGDFMLGITPDLIGAGRLFASLRTNNRVARTLDKSLRPVLKDTYERYSPITGAFGEMSFRNRQAANLRRLASRPFTSDASLQLAGLLEADRLARDLEYLGFLADDREIKRTQEAALARLEDNMARRSDVANFNRASINQTNREKALLLAARLKRNWLSVDNFLQGIESRLRTRLETDRERRNNFRLLTGVSDVETRYLDAIQGIINDARDWQAKHPGEALSTMPNYNNYVNALREMTRWKAALTYKTHADVYGYRYSNPYLAKDPTSILSAHGYKKGGVLKPSTMNLINKVIKNESYT